MFLPPYYHKEIFTAETTTVYKLCMSKRNQNIAPEGGKLLNLYIIRRNASRAVVCRDQHHCTTVIYNITDLKLFALLSGHSPILAVKSADWACSLHWLEELIRKDIYCTLNYQMCWIIAKNLLTLIDATRCVAPALPSFPPEVKRDDFEDLFHSLNVMTHHRINIKCLLWLNAAATCLKGSDNPRHLCSSTPSRDFSLWLSARLQSCLSLYAAFVVTLRMPESTGGWINRSIWIGGNGSFCDERWS